MLNKEKHPLWRMLFLWKNGPGGYEGAASRRCSEAEKMRYVY